MKAELLAAYARLAVQSGVNLQKHQTLLIDADIETAEFTRMVVKEAYECGAKEVIVTYNDTLLNRYQYLYQSEDTLQTIHAWQVDKNLDYLKEGACRLSIISPQPDAMKDCDPQKMALRQKAMSEANREVREYTMASKVQWSIVAVPNANWASLLFPDMEETAAVERLWEAILHCVYVNEDSDPLVTWKQRDERFQSRIDVLNKEAFTQLHFSNSLGTDLYVALADGHIWGGGSEMGQNNVRFNPNIPTEEVFTTPHRDHVNGTVYASRPLLYNGNLIKDFHFTFENGKVVAYDAKEGKSVLKAMLEMDEGATYLGEVALVPYDSAISQSALLFYNTLFDENAACHLALGNAYPSCIANGVNLDEEQLRKKGSNISMIHVDFMFGTADLNVKGQRKDGTWIDIFQNGCFVI